MSEENDVRFERDRMLKRKWVSEEDKHGKNGIRFGREKQHYEETCVGRSQNDARFKRQGIGF